ncbi:MAG: aspartate/glutamate racemase family protein [Thaumarchaeota archaeon]|nr:aspartate/glutamate racemase family protein [Nitrososphaerota archaeon]
MLEEQKRIGMIYPAAGRSEQEFEKLAPPDVRVHVTRIKWRREEKKELLEMEKYLADAALLLAQARVDIILFNCTTCSLVRGYGYDQELVRQIEGRTGLPAMTTATAAILALNELGLKKITLLTAYPDEMNEIEERFLREHGVDPTRVVGAGISDPFEQHDKSPGFWYEFAKQNFDLASQGLFYSCAGIRMVEIIEKLEQTLHVPVVASNQAAMWACLTKIGHRRAVEGYGMLLRNLKA